MVIVALMFVVLMAGAAMSIDIGRFYAERRFIQTAVDNAALACAINYARGGTTATAYRSRRTVPRPSTGKAAHGSRASSPSGAR